MANILIHENGKFKSYIESANTLEYLTGAPPSKDQVQQFAKPGILVNPDLSAVSSVPRKYWKIANNSVVEMTEAEKQAIDNAELTERKKAGDALNVPVLILIEELIKIINQRLPAGQKITKQEVVDAVKARIT